MLTDETIAQLQDEALVAFTDWKTEILGRIDEDVEFLGSIDVSLSALSEEPAESATDDAMSLVEQIQTA
jgi:hypothetical protein